MATNGASPEVFVVDACRTPVGRYRGALSGIRPDDLAAAVLRALLDRNPAVPADAIEDVVMGGANQAGEDNRNVARMAALLAGFPLEVGGATVNRLCGSGLEAVNQITAGLRSRIGDVAIAGGVEAMSRAPFVLPRPDERLPRRQELVDTVLGWRMVNPKMPVEQTIPMGATAEVLAQELNISREDQDAFALESHRRAIAAQEAGAFDAELIPVTPPGDGVEPVTIDEGPRRDTTLEKLAKLRPAFVEGGTVTAGNSSSFNDGAAAVLLANEEGLAAHGLEPLARVVTWATAGVEPRRMGIGPVPALNKALSRANWKLEDLAVVELNEAFAAQSLAVVRTLGLDLALVNPRGGAIALGHPLGCSGARLMATLVHQLRGQPAGTRGAATMCIGVGQGIATLVERV
ncbi:MAG TPA: thiolase family protein [Acidimicrobiia bacterium]|jgi:3-oxoadipyl-CoA thiolase|nr:thiolase family protein [Acidimicrobiia bacterium]